MDDPTERMMLDALLASYSESVEPLPVHVYGIGLELRIVAERNRADSGGSGIPEGTPEYDAAYRLALAWCVLQGVSLAQGAEGGPSGLAVRYALGDASIPSIDLVDDHFDKLLARSRAAL